ncbi:MAG: 30S ribosome-binding factor RbfA [Pseudomonadota bacterium]
MGKRTFNSGTGPSQRQRQVGEALRRALSEILLRGDFRDPELSRWSITVGEVRASPDMKHATAFVLPLGGKDADAALDALKANAGEIRHQLGKAVKLKYTPTLRFALDETFDRMDETRRLLDSEAVRRDLEPRDGQDPREDD